jgi:ABC-2 type transport system ATP-binding protein
MSNHPVVFCKNLVKRYGGPLHPAAVANLNLVVQPGEIVVLLGPNGSGKTSLLQLLAGLIHPSSGSVEVFGQKNPEMWAGKVAWLSEKENYPLELSGLEYLIHLGRLSGYTGSKSRESARKAIEAAGLGLVKDARMRTYSAGMLKKVALAGMEIGHPETYLLDEPAESLEPDSRQQLLQNLRQKADEGKTVILSTHHPDFLPGGKVRLVVLRSGGIVFDGGRDNFTGKIQGYRLELPTGTTLPFDFLSHINLNLEITSSEILIKTPEPAARKVVLEKLLEVGITPERMQPVQPGVEQRYQEILDKNRQQGGQSS